MIFINYFVFYIYNKKYFHICNKYQILIYFNKNTLEDM